MNTREISICLIDLERVPTCVRRWATKSTAGTFCRQLPTTTNGAAGKDACDPHARMRALHRDTCAPAHQQKEKSMSRELIVSVNGKEKKIAIVENDRVTEFYIERGEQNQGIVGNIYKGRVMRVLPGMQSAFVDIGLERDAFLYVTDFFDEEAEFERIVVDKSKKGDAESAARAATEHIELARVQREQQVEATHERAEPLREVDPAAIAAEEITEEEVQETATRRRGRRGGRGRSRAAKTETLPAPEERSIVPVQTEIFDTPFATGASFERISDDEERAMNGEMFKDARLQERIMDAVHAVEFDLEDVPSAPVGSLLTGNMTESGEFQRVADDDESAATPGARPRELEPAHVRDFVDEIADESSRAPSFQRVSDEDEARAEVVEAKTSPSSAAKRESASDRRKKKTGVISRFFKSKKAEDEEAEATAGEPASKETFDTFPDSEADIPTGGPHEELARRRGGRRRRRPTKRAPGSPEGNGAEGANGHDDEAEVIDESFEAEAAVSEQEQPSTTEATETAEVQ